MNATGYPGKTLSRAVKLRHTCKGQHTNAENDGGGQALARVLTEFGIDGSLRGSSDSSDQAEEGGENNVIEDSSHCCMWLRWEEKGENV